MHHRFTDATQENKGGIGSSSFWPIRIFYSTSGLHDLTTVIALHWGACWELLSSSVLHQMIYNTHCNENKVLCVSSNVSSFLCSRLVEFQAKEGQRSIYLNGLVPWLQFYINFYAFSLDTAAYFKDDSWYRKLLAVLMAGSNSEQSYHATKDKWKGMRTKWKDYPDAII